MTTVRPYEMNLRAFLRTNHLGLSCYSAYLASMNSGFLGQPCLNWVWRLLPEISVLGRQERRQSQMFKAILDYTVSLRLA